MTDYNDENEFENELEELEEELEYEEESDEDDSAEEENNQRAYTEIMAEMASAIAMSMPPVSFAVAVAEVAKASWDLFNAESNSPEASQAKFQLLMGVICVIPGIGGGFRLAFKSLIRKPHFYGPVIFDVVVNILEEANRLFKLDLPLNPEQYLTSMIDAEQLSGYLDEVRGKAVAELNQYTVMRWLGAPAKLDSYLRLISGQMTLIVEDVLAPAVRIAIERCILRRKKAAVTKSQGDLSARIRSNFQGMKMNFLIGGVGEHIADYYCLEELGWGSMKEGYHDIGKASYWEKQPGSLYFGKLNDKFNLNKNKAIGNDTGIDGFWRANPDTNKGKKYAIVETKATTGVASHDPKNIANKLRVLKAKNKGKPIVQMDHFWIGKRLEKELNKLPLNIRNDFTFGEGKSKLSKMYTRHILFVSLLVEPGLSHIEAILNLEKPREELNEEEEAELAAKHATHKGAIVHKYGETAIQQIINEKLKSLKNSENKKKSK